MQEVVAPQNTLIQEVVAPQNTLMQEAVAPQNTLMQEVVAPQNTLNFSSYSGWKEDWNFEGVSVVVRADHVGEHKDVSAAHFSEKEDKIPDELVKVEKEESKKEEPKQEEPKQDVEDEA